MKTIEINGFLQRNLKLLNNIETERNRSFNLQQLIEKRNQEIIKLSSKKNNDWLYGAGGVAVGVIITLLVSN